MTLHGWQNLFKKSRPAAKPGMEEYMASVLVWLLAGSIKWIRPSVTFQSDFQNPVTNYSVFVAT